jgi:hypothetical protein
MNIQEAKAMIQKGIIDYDEARITRLSLDQIVEHALQEVFDTGYSNGLMKGDDEEVEFEAEFDMGEVGESGNTDDDLAY